MSDPKPHPEALRAERDDRMTRARALAAEGQALQAELLLRQVLHADPRRVDALRLAAELALARGDGTAAVGALTQAARLYRDDPEVDLELADLLLRLQQRGEARAVLEGTVRRFPATPVAWLVLGALRRAEGDDAGSLRAWFEAVTRAQQAGDWVSEASTPSELLTLVVAAIEAVRTRRREILFASYARERHTHGAQAVARVDHALRVYLRESDARPADPQQRPKFFYFPDLPGTPWHDPFLQPWARRLADAFPDIRGEALRVIAEDRKLPNFLQNDASVEYAVSGSGPDPAWEAFFFWRHGERFDANHARCPRTSALLEDIELCRIEGEAPEILYSVLRPGSHINPHHGVSNVRLVMHLPLVVPADCALHLVGHGEHAWQEGRLVMFDDTYLHEAWNRSADTRVVLLMDCWNPHLDAVEKAAVKALIETITALQLADRSTRAAEATTQVRPAG